MIRTNYIDKIGKTYGKLTVTSYVGFKGKNRVFACKCECGNDVNVLQGNLISGKTKSCGCVNKDRQHVYGKTREYRLWALLKYRTKSKPGLLCEEWQSFDNFINDMGFAPEEYKYLGRIDIGAPFKKDNCVWAKKRQYKPHRTPVYNGMSMATAARNLGVSREAIRSRISRGWSLEDAFTKEKKV